MREGHKIPGSNVHLNYGDFGRPKGVMELRLLDSRTFRHKKGYQKFQKYDKMRRSFFRAHSYESWAASTIGIDVEANGNTTPSIFE